MTSKDSASVSVPGFRAEPWIVLIGGSGVHRGYTLPREWHVVLLVYVAERKDMLLERDKRARAPL